MISRADTVQMLIDTAESRNALIDKVDKLLLDFGIRDKTQYIGEERQYGFYATAARELSCLGGNVLELGRWSGMSTRCFFEGLHKKATLISVDKLDRENFDICPKPSKRVKLLMMDSVDLRVKKDGKIKDKCLAVVLVDTLHTVERVMLEIDAYWPHVVDGGIMIFDDINLPGLKAWWPSFTLPNSVKWTTDLNRIRKDDSFGTGIVMKQE